MHVTWACRRPGVLVNKGSLEEHRLHLLDRWSLCFEPELWPSQDTSTDVENKHVGAKGEGAVGWVGRSAGRIHTIDAMYKTANY